MKRRILSIFLAAGLVTSVFAVATPVAAQAPEVPEEPNIVDPPGDGNYLNDGTGFGVGGKDNTTPADVSSVGDILAIWFTNTADTVSVHFQTEAPGPAAPSYLYRVFVDPGVGEDCLWFQGFAPGAGNTSDEPSASVRLVGGCGDETIQEGEFVQEAGADGSGIHSITVPRSIHSAFEDGGVLAAPSGEVRHLAVAATYPTVDNTEVGTDYTIGGGGDVAEEAPEEVQEEPKKAKKKNCKRFKNKKKRRACQKRNKAPAACTDFQPGELGAEADTIKITDAATEEEPVEQTVELGMSAADADLLGLILEPTEAYFNIQVDSKSPEAGLYVFMEFPTRRDYDLNLLHPDGSYAARARSFNPVVGTPGEAFSNPGHGGEGTDNSEKLLGIKTADCGGWTQQVQNWFGEGGEFTIQVWLGDAQTDPQAPGEETP